jgi:hypothetical protein
MEKRLFNELVASLRQAADIARGGRKRRPRRRLGERIREERWALQAIGPRAFRKRLPRQRQLRPRSLAGRPVRRKVIKR